MAGNREKGQAKPWSTPKGGCTREGKEEPDMGQEGGRPGAAGRGRPGAAGRGRPGGVLELFDDFDVSLFF